MSVDWQPEHVEIKLNFHQRLTITFRDDRFVQARMAIGSTAIFRPHRFIA